MSADPGAAEAPTGSKAALSSSWGDAVRWLSGSLKIDKYYKLVLVDALSTGVFAFTSLVLPPVSAAYMGAWAAPIVFVLILVGGVAFYANMPMFAMFGRKPYAELIFVSEHGGVAACHCATLIVTGVALLIGTVIGFQLFADETDPDKRIKSFEADGVQAAILYMGMVLMVVVVTALLLMCSL
jgi:hypothetical protein